MFTLEVQNAEKLTDLQQVDLINALAEYGFTFCRGENSWEFQHPAHNHEQIVTTRFLMNLKYAIGLDNQANLSIGWQAGKGATLDMCPSVPKNNNKTDYALTL